MQIFATDLDPEAIEVARLGVYPESIAADVSPGAAGALLHPGGAGFYRIKKEIREMLVFAPQNLIEDPPFTKLDLLSCRNLLIYLEGRLQQRLMPLFHYACGRGASCSSARRSRWAASATCSMPSTRSGRSSAAARSPRGSYRRATCRCPGRDLPSRGDQRCWRWSARPADHGLAQAAERALLQHLVPPCIIMHERGEIVHIHGRTGQFLEPAPGSQGSANVYNMAREGLQLDLAVAVRHAAELGRGASSTGACG